MSQPGSPTSVLSHGLIGGETDYPDPADVRAGVVYAGGALVGTLGTINPADSWARQVASLIEAAGIGVFGASIFTGVQPTEPSECITTYDTTGRRPDAALGVDYPNVQAIVRGARDDYPGAWNRAKAVKDALLGISPIGQIRGITMPGDIMQLEPDDKGRPEFSLNFYLAAEPIAAGNRIPMN